jgi:hypothetical protein
MAGYKLISTDPVITSTANTTSAVQHFREISAGAGANIWKVNSEGQFMGATDYSSAPFKVSYQGAVTCSNISITGGTITGATLSGIAAGSMLNIQGWTSTMTFSATNYRTVTWTVGVITLADGTTFNIATGNTGNMAALTYIYFDKAVSTTALQITTTAATAVGANKILVAVAQNNSDTTSEATLQVFGGSGGMLVKADNIAANTITANEIAANTVTAAKMNVTQLSAIAANLGTITAGTVTGATIQTASTGRRVKITTDQYIRWYSDTTLEAYICNDAGGNLVIDADNTIQLTANGSGDDIAMLAGDDITLTAVNLYIACTGDMGVNEADSQYINYNSDGTNAVIAYVDRNDWEAVLDDDGNFSIDGSFSDTGADYAEYFESQDGKSIPIGTTVVTDNDKIRPAQAGEAPIGVISSIPTMVGNSDVDCGKNWSGKYLTDDFGKRIIEKAEFWKKHIIEEVVKPNGKLSKRRKLIYGYSSDTPPPKGAEVKIVDREKINPSWNKSQKYVSRKDRPEWNVVGLVGRVRLLKGQPVADKWIKLRDISNSVEEWLIK